MNSCLNCKHASWSMTKNGRVNPHRGGRCTWQKTVYVALSYQRLPNPEGRLEMDGGYIWRNHPHQKCPTFQERG